MLWRKCSYIIKAGKLFDLLNWFLYTLCHFPRFLRAFFPRGLQTVLPNTDKLHVRCCDALHAKAAGLHDLPVAAPRGERHRDPRVVRCPRTAEWTGAAARPARSCWAAHQWQGTESLWQCGERISISQLLCSPLDFQGSFSAIFQMIFQFNSVLFI